MAAQRFYSSTATATTLTSGVNGSVTTISVASVTGFPVSFPFTLILDDGETSEEVVQVNSASGLNLTVTRGVDNTTGVSHTSGARVIHGVSARDYREPQEHIGATSNIHGYTGDLAGDLLHAVKAADIVASSLNADPGSTRLQIRAGLVAVASDSSGEAFIPYSTPFPGNTLAVTALPSIAGASAVRLALRGTGPAPYGMIANGFRIQGALADNTIAVSYIAIGY